MTDWCLYGEATDIDGESYSMAPDIVIVNVPDEMVLSRRKLFRFLRKRAGLGRRELELLKRKELAPTYWGFKELYTPWGKFLRRLGFYQQCNQDRLTLIPLRGELPADLKLGFLAFGTGFLVRFYDWAGCNDENQLKMQFSFRHPGLMEPSKQELTEVREFSLAK